MWWGCDFIEIDEDGNAKYFRRGEEVAYPWVLIEDDEVEADGPVL